jgi:hypothetical protein
MKLPANSLIPLEKVTRYLLVPLTRADKSAFLARGGYTLANAERLMQDIRAQMLALDALPAGINQFGQYYEIRGALRGPSGVALRVKTIWMREHLSEVTRFITLLPDKSTAL